MTLGQAIYNYRCYFCHGYSGDANTLASTYMKPPPVSFISKSIDAYTPEAMADVIRNGKPGTAMMSFAKLLDESEISAVVHFVRNSFMQNKAKNTRYHTVENGWENHEQYRDAYPYALGELALDQDWATLTESQQRGRQLFLTSCISCHDRGRVKQEGIIWESFPLSWPRNGLTPEMIGKADAVSSASPYSLHDTEVDYRPITIAQQRGRELFKKNCSFCHAADGSGKNWIGQFIEPHPRNFLQSPIQNNFSKHSLSERINNGVNGTAMPAWRYVLSEQEVNDLVEYLWGRFK